MNIKIEISIDGEKVSIKAPVKTSNVKQIRRIEKTHVETGGLPASFEDAVQQMMVGPIPKKTDPQA